MLLPLLMVCLSSAFGQSSLDLKFHKSYENVQLCSIDKKNNVFIADENANIFKIDSNGNQVVHFSPNVPAQITMMDINSSSRLMIFYEELQEILFLDWLLSPISKHQFDMDQFGYVSAVCQSANNMLWVVDNSSFTLSKYDPLRKQVIVETNLEALLGSDLHPLLMKEIDNFLYVSTEKNGVLVFDNLGNYKKKLPFNNLKHFDIQNGIFYWNESETGLITYFDLLGLNTTEEKVGVKGYIYLRDDKWFVIRNGHIMMYKENP